VDEVHTKLADLVSLVESARAMPMSASCVVNRADVLERLGDIESMLPETITRAQEVLGDKQGLVEEGRREAAQIVADAKEERRRLLEATDVHREATAEAARLLDEARASAEAMRLEVEDYVDAKLANFEIVLTKTLSAVERGREKLSGRHELERLSDVAEEDATFLDEPLHG
jgi:hypothetical protein